MRRTSFFISLTALVILSASAASAADSPSPTEVEQAREAFKRGTELARDTQWGAALAAFERSSKLRSSAGTTYNIGVCERALGQYVRARKTFARALRERRSEADLPDATVADLQRFVTEIESLVATLEVTLAPADVAVSVDGQPLELSDGSAWPTGALLAGTQPAGPGKAVGTSKVRLVLDPGTHVFVLTREGFASAVHNETLRPGEKKKVDLVVDRLPATLNVSADRPGAVVSVNAVDVGVVPVSVSRPLGRYHVVVKHPGFVSYETDASLQAGQSTDLRASLKAESPSIFSRWWFWTAAGVLVAGAVTTTYLVTRPEPERPPLDGGGLGWTARAP